MKSPFRCRSGHTIPIYGCFNCIQESRYMFEEERDEIKLRIDELKGKIDILQNNINYLAKAKMNSKYDKYNWSPNYPSKEDHIIKEEIININNEVIILERRL